MKNKPRKALMKLRGLGQPYTIGMISDLVNLKGTREHEAAKNHEDYQSAHSDF